MFFSLAGRREHGQDERCVTAHDLPTLRIVGVPGLPEVQPGDDLTQLIVAAIQRAALTLSAADIVVCTQKIVSKAEGRLVRIDSIEPSDRAREWAGAWNRDARVIELSLQEAARIVRMERSVLITQTRHGFICANSGVDTSNVSAGWAALLPVDPDASARRLCAELRAAFDAPVGVIISDTFGRPWREGQTNVAIGVSGLRPIIDYRGSLDRQGQLLRSTAIAVADELAAAAEIVMGKTLGIPIAIVSGSGVEIGGVDEGSGRDLLRRHEEDLFR